MRFKVGDLVAVRRDDKDSATKCFIGTVRKIEIESEITYYIHFHPLLAWKPYPDDDKLVGPLTPPNFID